MVAFDYAEVYNRFSVNSNRSDITPSTTQWLRGTRSVDILDGFENSESNSLRIMCSFPSFAVVSFLFRLITDGIILFCHLEVSVSVLWVRIDWPLDSKWLTVCNRFHTLRCHW